MIFEGNGDMNIYRAAEILKVQERYINDFSRPVNPLGPSQKVKAELRRYLKRLNEQPDPDCVRIRKHLAGHLKADKEQIICGADHRSLLNAIITAVLPVKLIVNMPDDPGLLSISSHEGTGTGESNIRTISSSKEEGFLFAKNELIDNMTKGDMALISNPNVITGRCLDRKNVLELAEAAREKKCYMLIDESLTGFCNGGSVADAVSDNGFIIVLSSLSPYYGLCGLGFSFAVLNQDLIGKITKSARVTPPDLLSQRAAAVALKDRVYVTETEMWLKTEKVFIEKELKKAGVEFVRSESSSYLIHTDLSEQLYNDLFKKRSIVKRCDDMPGLGKGYLYIALRDHRSNAELIKGIKNFISRNHI